MEDLKIITQIGSLPYGDPKKAIEYSQKHDIPFLPELTKRGEYMFIYIKNPGSLVCLEPFKNHRYDVAKIQCIGPATLHRESSYSELEIINMIRTHIDRTLDGLQTNRVILFLDEPYIDSVLPGDIRLWEKVFHNFDVEKGIHSCGNMFGGDGWDEIFYGDVIDIISFDATIYDITRVKSYRGNKKIAWGVRSLDDVKDFREGDLITPPCGLNFNIVDGKAVSYTDEDCERTLDNLLDIKECVLRKLYKASASS